MSTDNSYTTEEIANLLRISKLTVYDLIKKGELPAYRVGRQMRVDASDLEAYKARSKGEFRQPPAAVETPPGQHPPLAAQAATARDIIISGQDVSLDMLASHLRSRDNAYRPLRSYVGSMNSLIAMYMGGADIVSTHLYDGDTGEYNIRHVRSILSGHRYLIVNLLSRWAGFYVQAGNPHGIRDWTDLQKPGIRMVNREKGSGARTLIEEMLRNNGIRGCDLAGYEREEASHLAVAGAVARKEADVGIGIEKAASMVQVDFIPLVKERYDLVLLKKEENKQLIAQVLDILRSESYQKELGAIGGYDLTDTGQILYETW
ncbi:substrate-binding domain-containing protein [Brevibacillus sp. GCM10020057]|uniref:substrate-binding domain-containing protein n=1 Tax=Brevibacillus sp. GCM10020057 TaxID=3317327 RepID=UPI003639B7F8